MHTVKCPFLTTIFVHWWNGMWMTKYQPPTRHLGDVWLSRWNYTLLNFFFFSWNLVSDHPHSLPQEPTRHDTKPLQRVFFLPRDTTGIFQPGRCSVVWLSHGWRAALPPRGRQGQVNFQVLLHCGTGTLTGTSTNINHSFDSFRLSTHYVSVTLLEARAPSQMMCSLLQEAYHLLGKTEQ